MAINIGANYLGRNKCKFTLWAPLIKRVSLKIVEPFSKIVDLKINDAGYWETVVDGVTPGARYFYVLNNEIERPDPASFYQPLGVHGPSEVIDNSVYKWRDKNWKGIELSKAVMYEIHIGAFTNEGNFESAILKLDYLKDLGINYIEIMPVNQFPGKRNWGYDGVYPFAVQNSYGGPEGLKKFVDACHSRGIAVILDVVYNHLGPEGNYIENFAPYFTDRYKTPWGKALNFDGAYSDDVRNYFIQNALYWFKDFHLDALRLDAIHGIFDFSARHILEELQDKTNKLAKSIKRKLYLIAESDLNDPRTIKDKKAGGYGVNAQWNDDFHHCLHTLLTKEKSGYYEDFGTLELMAKAIKEGFVYDGNYSRYRKRKHGGSVKDISADKFVVFSQNHDQVGNRMNGERLSSLVDLDGLKVAAAMIFMSPNIPLLFMGEEYGEKSPFLYFNEHSDEGLIKAVREGRKEEFKAFGWETEPPDPQDEATFNRSKLKWNEYNAGEHETLRKFYEKLMRIRKSASALREPSKKGLEVKFDEEKKLLFIKKTLKRNGFFCIINFNGKDEETLLKYPKGKWRKILDSSDKIWAGKGSSLPEESRNGIKCSIRARSAVFYEKENS